MAGVAGAALGISGGLGGVLAACGEEETTTTTAITAASSTTAGAATTVGATTTVATAAEMGAEIKIGFVTPKTGVLAAFSQTDSYLIERFNESVGEEVLADKKNHVITIVDVDSQSDSNRAAQVAGDLSLNENVQILVTAGSPDSVNPVAGQAEANNTPCFATDAPWQTFLGAQPEAGYKWSWMFSFGLEDVMGNYTTVWNALPTNKKIAAMWPNDADGNVFAQVVPPIMEGAGLTVVDGGRWQPGSEDYTQQISLFKKEGCEVMEGVFVTSDFTNFWQQCHQQGWVPMIACVDKGLLYPEAIESVGAPLGYNLTSTLFWGPTWPYKSYVTGETDQQFADEFAKRTGKQWSSALLHGVIFEMALWALRNAEDPTSRESINAVVPKMKLEGQSGLIDFTGQVEEPQPGPRKIDEHVYKSPTMAGQWVKGTHGHAFDYVSVSNVAAPNIPVDAPLMPIEPQ